MKFASLDLETTGLDPETCQAIQVAVVVENTELDPLPRVEDLQTLDLGLWATSYEGDAYALGLNEALLQALRSDNAVDFVAQHHGRQLRCVRDMNGWAEVEKFLGRLGGKIYVGGKNVAGFDLRFCPPKIRAMCHHRTVDVGSVALGARPRYFEHGIPSMDTILEDLFDEKAKHDALHDARDNIRVIRELTDYYGRGAEAVAKADVVDLNGRDHDEE